jgi:hypothetical protein
MRARDESFLLRGTDADEAALWQMVAGDKKPALLPIQEAYIDASVANARIEAEIRQRQEALKTLDAHTIPAFLFSGGAITFYIWNTYGARFEASGWRVAIGIGILFGICIATATLFSHELVKIRFPDDRRMRFIASSLHAFLLSSASWSVIQLIYFREIDLQTIWFGGFGLALGFVLSATFELPSWQGFWITLVATYIPIFFASQIGAHGWTSNNIPLLYFHEAYQRFTIGLPLALFIAIGRYAFPLWLDLQRLITSNQQRTVKGALE